jgi:hypothetical protein
MQYVQSRKLKIHIANFNISCLNWDCLTFKRLGFNPCTIAICKIFAEKKWGSFMLCFLIALHWQHHSVLFSKTKWRYIVILSIPVSNMILKHQLLRQLVKKFANFWPKNIEVVRVKVFILIEKCPYILLGATLNEQILDKGNPNILLLSPFRPWYKVLVVLLRRKQKQSTNHCRPF